MQTVAKLTTLLSALALCPSFVWAKENPDRVCQIQQFSKNPEKNGSDADLLGWITLPPGKNLCNGLYQNPVLPDADKPLVPFDQSPVKLSFVEASIHQEGRSTVSDVIVTQPQRLLTSDIAYINRDPKTHELDTLDMQGHVTLREPGKLIIGDTGRVGLRDRTGDFRNVLYRLSLNPELSARPALLETPTNSGRTLTAQGRAERAQQLRPGFMEFQKATYSTCSPADVLWQLRATRVTLNRETGRGEAYHARLYVKNVPVFYTPYFNFPIDSRRKSGILFPTYGRTTLGGLSLQIPFYWNIAPNYDATIAPRWFEKRGVQINTEFRYLTPESRGLLYLNALPGDQAFEKFKLAAPLQYTSNTPYQVASLNRLASANPNRGYISWRNTSHLSPRWSSNIDFTAVSDDYYYRDFTAPRPLTINNQLLQQADLKYSGDPWNMRFLLQQYQTLHPVDQAPLNKVYGMLPQISLSAAYPNQKYGLTYQIANEYTHFIRQPDPGAPTAPPVGDRLHIQPGISLPINGISGYITPNLQFLMTGYQLRNQPASFANQSFSNHITRTLPVFSVDSGIYFDKETTLGSQTFQQTLEPRLFYLYAPYTNQSQIPLFDSALPTFNYDQLFRTNRFNGIDRIGDANQLTFALTTRFLDQDSGQEKIRASIGQIYFFQDRLVSACVPTPPPAPPGNPFCAPPPFSFGNGASTTRISPLAGQLAYTINPLWSATANLTWDPNSKQYQNGSVNFQYRPGGVNRVINLGYNYLQFGDPLRSNPPPSPNSNQNNLNQIIASAVWPIKDRWQFMGSWNYNISHNRSQNFFYGLEYNNCCVAAQLVIGRTFAALSPSNIPQYNSAIYFQLQFKGFGNFGTTSPLTALGTIPGYQDRFGRL